MLFLALFLCLKSLAQDISINKGEIIKDRQFLIDKKEITASDENGNFVSIRPHRVNGTLRNYYIEFFNQLNFVERIEVNTENQTQILDVFIRDNKVHILIKENENKNVSLRFDVFNLNQKTLTRKELISINKDQDKPLYNALKNNTLIAIHHDDKNYLLSFPVIDNQTAYTFLEYFDNDLNSISQHTIYPDKNLHKKNITFLNVNFYNSKAFILYSLINENKDNYYQLIEFENNKTKDLILNKEPDVYELINTKIINNTFFISGLFSKKKKGAFEGFTFYKIDLNTFKLTSKNLSSFLTEDASKYFLGLFKSNRSIDIKDIFIDREFNIYLIGQFYTTREQRMPLSIPIAAFPIGSFTAFISYNPVSISYKVYDDILISKISSDGELIWDNLLNLKETQNMKSKYNQKDSSYYAFLQNNELHILMNGYLDSKKNQLLIKQDKRNSKTNFYNITVDSNGDILPELILKNAESEILFKANNTLKSGNTIYNLGQGNMRKQLLQINF